MERKLESVMTDFVTQEKAHLQAQIAKLNEQLSALVRYEELSGGEVKTTTKKTKVATANTSTPKTTPKSTPSTDAPKKRGRPKGSKNKPKEATAGGEGKSLDLPTLLETIGQSVDKPLVLSDFVTLVREAGYTTKAKDFSNMVYQALLKLVKRGSFKKNEETRAYEFVGEAA